MIRLASADGVSRNMLMGYFCERVNCTSISVVRLPALFRRSMRGSPLGLRTGAASAALEPQRPGYMDHASAWTDEFSVVLTSMCTVRCVRSAPFGAMLTDPYVRCDVVGATADVCACVG